VDLSNNSGSTLTVQYSVMTPSKSGEARILLTYSWPVPNLDLGQDLSLPSHVIYGLPSFCPGKRQCTTSN